MIPTMPASYTSSPPSSAVASSSSGAEKPRRPPPPSPFRPNSSTHAQRRAAALQRQPPIPNRGAQGTAQHFPIKGGSPKSLWQSWLSIPPSNRMALGTALAVFAVVGLMAAKKLEVLVPAPKSTDDISPETPRQPKLFGLTAVERQPIVPMPTANEVSDPVKPASLLPIALVGSMLLPRAARAKSRQRTWPSGYAWRGPASLKSALTNVRRAALSTCHTPTSQTRRRSVPPVYLSRVFWPRLSTSDPPLHDKGSLPGSADESLSMLIRGGYIRQSSSGVFTFLFPGLTILRRIQSIVGQEMDSIHASRIEMPTLLSNKLWKKSGRDESMGSELYRVQDRKGGKFVLGPTHEEEVTKVVGAEVHSYKQLPVKVYQMTRKYRDEPRPRLGLLRTREFEMKDMYTFDASVEDAKQSYKDVQRAYERIMDRLLSGGRAGQGSAWKMAQADSGAMGGILSHEYHVEDPAGEDDIISCSACSYTANAELAVSGPAEDKDVGMASSGFHCASCGSGILSKSKSIEVGHTFLLGTRYSQALGYKFTSKSEVDPTTGKQMQQKQEYFQMGCYGIGITRLMGVLALKARRDFLRLQAQENEAALPVETKKKGKAGTNSTGVEVKPGLLWPKNLAPYSHFVILPPSALSNESSAPGAQKEVDLLLQRFGNGEATLTATSAPLRTDATVVTKEQVRTGESAPEDPDEQPISVLIDDRPNVSLADKFTDADLSGAQEVWIIRNGNSVRVR